MGQRLVWNFEFSTTNIIPLSSLVDNKHEVLKWERRFFWPKDYIINLCTLDNTMLDLHNYHQKHKEDYYYLIPGYNYNIKRRHDELSYKPILKQTSSAAGFGFKINLDTPLLPNQGHLKHPEIQEIARQAQEKGIITLVKKEAFIYRFPTTPFIKLELARLEVNNEVYLSACVEGKSLFLVEKISEYLLGQQVSCEYVTFLKDKLKL